MYVTYYVRVNFHRQCTARTEGAVAQPTSEAKHLYFPCIHLVINIKYYIT